MKLLDGAGVSVWLLESATPDGACAICVVDGKAGGVAVNTRSLSSVAVAAGVASEADEAVPGAGSTLASGLAIGMKRAER